MIQITVNKDGTVSNNRIIIGNKYENNDEVLQFTLPSDYANYSNYVVATIKSRFYNETRLIPIVNNQVKITNSITYFDGTWNLYVMCRSVALDLKGDLTDISARDSEHVFISNAIQAVINKNTIDKDKITMEEVDDTIKIVYDQLIVLIKQQQTVNTTVETNEAARIKAEQGRVSAENTRVTNEDTRIANEKARKTNETNRQSAETNRISAEKSRVSAESTRASNESTRQTQETSRVNAEKSRVAAESGRVTAENTRVSNENTRKDNESKRVTAENTRIANEKARVLAEEERNKNFDKLKGEVEGDVSGKVDLITQAKNEALAEIKQQESSYQEQIDELQRKNVLQDNQLSQLQEEVDQKVNQPYINSKGKTSVNNSDEGMLRNFEVYGRSEQYSTSGKNLLNYISILSSANGITSTLNKDGSITTTGLPTINYAPVSNVINITDILKDGIQYTVSSDSYNPYVFIQINALKPDGTYNYYGTNTKKTTFTVNKATYTRYSILIQTSAISTWGTSSRTITNKYMLNEGSDALPFEKYTGGQPSPSPEYPQEIKSVVNPTIKVVGKNICPIQPNITNLDLEVGRQYTVSTNKNVYRFKISLDRGSSSSDDILLEAVNTKGQSKATFIVNRIKNWKLFIWKYGDASNPNAGIFSDEDYQNYNVQLELGDKATEYVPYQEEQTLTLPTTLRGLPVTSGGNITIDGQQYISDMICEQDGDIGVLRNVTKYKLTSSDYCQIEENTIALKIPSNGNHFKTFDKLLCTDTKVDVLNKENDGYWCRLYSNDKTVTTVDKYKKRVDENEIYVYVDCVPTFEPFSSDIQAQYRALKSYYPSTNMFITSEQLDGYGTFDYKLNLKSWIEDKDNTDIDYNPSTEKEKYSESFFANWFALQRTGKVYTVKFPLWETSQSSLGTKLHDNAGLVCEASTPYVAGKTDYESIPVFRTYDVNAYTDDDGVIHVTAFKGDENFKDTGENDVFVLGTSYYEKYWVEDGYWYYSITDLPRDGYEIAAECKKKNGGIRPFAVYGKYVAGDINGKPYSSKGLVPAYAPFEAISAYHEVDYFGQRGKYYSGGMMWDYKYVATRFWLKFATLNSQSVLGGCSSYNSQYVVAKAESNVKRVILTKAQANNLLVGSCVSVGSGGVIDRGNKTVHDIVRNAQITEIVAIDDTYSAIYLDVDKPFTTTKTCAVTTMHWLSGYSDQILGRDGSLGKTATDQRYPIVISGIELMVGGYEIPSNVMMDIKGSDLVRDVYITNDATKLSKNTTTIMSTWKKSQYQIKGTNTNNWNYITAMGIDTKNGGVFPTASGQSGSGSGTGYADGVYFANATSGQREFLLLGALRNGSGAGLCFLYADNDWSRAWWGCLGRLSLSGVGGA